MNETKSNVAAGYLRPVKIRLRIGAVITKMSKTYKNQRTGRNACILHVSFFKMAYETLRYESIFYGQKNWILRILRISIR